MSENIDYDELDKAVTAAISAKKAKAEEKAANAKLAKNKPAAMPARRGMVMDFAPRRPIRGTRPRPVAKPTPKPAAPVARAASAAPAAPKPASPVTAPKPVAKKPVAAPINRLINRPAAKPVTKTIARPTVAAAKPVARPSHTPAHPAQRAIAHQPAPAAQTAAHMSAQPTASRIPTQRPAAKPVAETAPAPAIRRREAPNANNYSLGGRSPFMTNAKVEKHPLGSNVPETSTAALRSTRNVYSQKSPTRATENAQKHIIAQDTGKKSGWLWTLIVIAVIAAGGGLGYLAYLLVFAH